MKTLKIFAAMIIAALTVSFTAQAQDTKKSNPNAEVTFSADIHCNNCKKKCDANLPFIKGVKDVKVSVEDKTVWFKYDESKVSKQKLATELAKLGYPGTEIVKEDTQKK